jgi:RNA polymerase sigma-70 factor (ECF subfamily)
VAFSGALSRLGGKAMTARAEEMARWLAEALAGAADSLGQALEACRGYLLSIAQQELDPQLRTKAGASDLVQETFLKAHRHFAQFHGSAEEELLAWLRRLLLNNLADFRRLYQETQKRDAGLELALSDWRLLGRTESGLIADEPSPSAEAMAHEQAEALQQTLDRLPEDYRQVLVWRHQEEHSFEEIGHLMNRSANAVRKLWARAVQRFQEEWERGHERR